MTEHAAASLVDALNRAETAAFDFALGAFSSGGAVFVIAVVAFLSALLSILVYRRLSDQGGIRRVRRLIDADLIALNLYRRSPETLPRILRGLLLKNLAYLRLSLKPLLILAVPFAITLVQLHGRYAFRPLETGETALVAVAVADRGLLDRPGAVALDGGPGATVETPPVRVPALRKVVWRVRAGQDGTHSLKVTAGGNTLTKRIVVGPARTALLSARVSARLPGALLHPGEPSIDPACGIEAVTISYPELRPDLAGQRLHWLIWFLLVLVASAWALKGILRVSI